MTFLTRPLLAALIFALLAPLSQVRGDDFAFVTVYATGHQTWALKNSYTDTLLVFYNVVTKPEGQVVTVNASNYVNAGSSNDTLISSDSYNLVITNVLKNVPEITSTLGIVAEINRSFRYQITATKSPGSFGASGLPAGLGVNGGSGVISGVPGQTGTFPVALAASGDGGVGQATLEFTVIDPPAFFAGSQYIPDNVYYLAFPGEQTFFGLYTDQFTPYLYHYDLGILYPFDANDASHGIYLYDFATKTFWYTTPSLFPIMYDFTLNTFIYYFPDTKRPGHYTTNPRIFYNFTTKQPFVK